MENDDVTAEDAPASSVSQDRATPSEASSVAKYAVEGAGESSDKKSNVLAQVRDATLIVAIYLYFTYR
jgi:hypothetical protein